MCNNESPNNVPRLTLPFSQESLARTTLIPVDQYRLQLYQYAVAERLRYPLVAPFSCPIPYGYPFVARSLQAEEPKPQHSYIGLIAMAILSAPDAKLVLSDIYQHILDNYPYFRTRGPGWRNSIRHNLSLNDCFIKAGRSANGKGHFWAIHPANVDDFRKGDFRRRKAQRKVRRHMGLSVDEEPDSPSPPPLPVSPRPTGVQFAGPSTSVVQRTQPKKRQFDVASLLAPDPSDEPEEEIDVVNSEQRQNRAEESGFASVFPIVNYYQALLQAQSVGNANHTPHQEPVHDET